MELKQKAKRTQIYLDPWQDVLIENRAEKRGTTKSAVIREAIDRYLHPKGKRQLSALEFFEELSRGMEEIKIPKDLSSRHDYYLYGKGSKEFK